MTAHEPTSLARAENRWLPPVCAATETGAMVERFDWTSSPLGSPDTWTQALRSAVEVCLASRFPMLVAWGPKLIEIYNDGCRPMLGSGKHPRALGAPAAEIWPEVWDELGPMFESVLATGESTWRDHAPLILERNGFREECYFTWSLSPLFDDDGTIGGVLDVVTETTVEVLARRRLACLSRLSVSLVDAEQVTDVCVRAVNALAASPLDIRAIDFHLLAVDRLVLVASNRRDDLQPLDDAELFDVLTSGTPRLIGGANDGTSPADHYVVPVGTPRASGIGVLVFSLSPRRPFAEPYQEFLDTVATTIGGALDASMRRTIEVGAHRRIADTLQAAMLRPVSDLPTVAARYLPAEGNLAVGGDWYDVIDLGTGRRALVVGDCVGHGLDAATVMAQLRSAARAMLLEGRDPAATLEGLDVFAAAVGGAEYATVVCAVVDRIGQTVTYSRAGHLPPLVVDDGDTVWLDEAGGPPLTLAQPGERVNAIRSWHNGQLLLMFSDGLIERRTESIDVGLERLRIAALELHGSTVHQVADGLLGRLLTDVASDDVVLVVKLLRPEAHEDR